jgi:hypothetical protein
MTTCTPVTDSARTPEPASESVAEVPAPVGTTPVWLPSEAPPAPVSVTEMSSPSQVSAMPPTTTSLTL